MKTRLTYLISRLHLLIILTLSFISCDENNENVPELIGNEGFFIINEGAFGGGNASLSFYDKASKSVSNDVFFNANGISLGDQAQSMTVIGDKGFVLVQNSGKIEVINLNDFSSLATIDTQDGIVSPRFMLAINENKAYVSDWGATGDQGSIKVLDLNTNTVTKTVAVGFGTNEMILLEGKVYVTNAGGFNNQTFEFKKDNSVTVLDASTDTIIATVQVGDNPESITVDGEGDIWVAGAGNTVYNPDYSINYDATTAGFLAEINIGNQSANIYTMPEKAAGPYHLGISPDGATLYFDYMGEVQNLSTVGAGANLTFNTFLQDYFYGFDIDPTNGNFIGLKAPDFSSQGLVEIYNNSAVLLKSFNVGIGPGEVAFK